MFSFRPAGEVNNRHQQSQLFSKMSNCLVSVGSNLGDPVAQVTACVELLRQHPQIDVRAVSSLHKTKPVGGPSGQQGFLNAAVRLETRLSPQQLLAELQQIENRLGRLRQQRWGPRAIDLDLLLYDNLVLHTDTLEIPHPRMAFRRFVIEPSNEIAGDMLHPLIGWTVSQLVKHLESAPDYVALTGIPGTGKTAVIRTVSERIRVRSLVDGGPQLDSRGTDPVRLAADETEILERRFKMLETVSTAQACKSLPPENDLFTISNFWFEQSAAYAKCKLPSDLQRNFFSAFDKFLPNVPRPKLLVVLERSLAKSGGKEASIPQRIELFARLQKQIVNRSRIPRRGPTLWLDSEDFSRVVDEITAAIEAMQSSEV